MGGAVLVPVKAFSRAKERLAPCLDQPARAALARAMASRVVAAAAPLPVAVVCDDAEVAAWAVDHGARVVWAPGRGLDGAVVEGVAQLGALGIERVVVAHADLPLAAGLAPLAEGTGITLVPDRSEDGTNVAVVGTASGFRFSYGPGSFRRHRSEAARLGLPLLVVRPSELTWDVDHPGDLDFPRPARPRCG